MPVLHHRSIAGPLLWSVLICGFLAWVLFRIKVEATPAWADGTLELVHQRLLSFNYYNNEQSRLLQYGIPELIHRLINVDLRTAYGLQRIAFIALALFTFHRFMAKWLKEGAALAALALYALLTAYTFCGDLQESAPLLAFTFVAALHALREERWWFYAVLVWVGALNNETMLFLPVIHVLVRFRSWSVKHLAQLLSKAFVLGLPAFISVGFIRLLTRDRPYLGGGWHGLENLLHLDAVLLFLGVFWVLAFLRFNSLPLFLQRSLIGIPLFLVPNLLVGIINEMRLLLPLCAFVIPAALWTLLPAERRSTTT